MVDVQPSLPVPAQYVTAVNADGTLTTKQVDYTELSFVGLYGAQSRCYTKTAVGYGLQTFVFDNVDGFQVDYTVEGRALAEPSQYIYGIVRSVDTTDRNLVMFVTVAPGAASGAIYSDWEFQVVAGPSFGIVASATTGYMTQSMAIPSVGDDVTFTTDLNKAFTTGSVILVSSLASSTGPASSLNYFEATVRSYDPTTGITYCHVSRVGGTGTYLAWIVQRSMPIIDIPNYISGFQISETSAGSLVLNISSGSCLDSTNSVMLYSRTAFQKSLSLVWTAGNASTHGIWKPLAGTAHVTNGSPSVTGSGTSFFTDYNTVFTGGAFFVTVDAGVLAQSASTATALTLNGNYNGANNSTASYGFATASGLATVFVVQKTADGTVDFICQQGTSQALSPIPSGYGLYRAVAQISVQEFAADQSYHYSGSRPLPAVYTSFGAAGSTHGEGLVPDPGYAIFPTTNRFLCEDATWKTAGSAFGSQSANNVYAGPTSGAASAPGFRQLVGADLPVPSSSSLGGVESLAAVSHNWINSISTSGVPTQTQPAFSDISGSVAASQLPNPSATTLGGVKSLAAATHNFLTQIGTDGSVSQAQPAFTDISGSVAAAQLPLPSSSTLGGIESLAAVTSKWINTISTSGVPSATQPAFSDISGTATAAQLPAPTSTTIGGVKSLTNASHKWINSIGTDGTPTQTQPAFSDLTGTVANTQGVSTIAGNIGDFTLSGLLTNSTNVLRVLAAVQSDMETGTSTTVAVVPGVQKNHPGHPKCWAYISQSAGTYTLAASYGVSSISKVGTGVVDITLSTSFSGATVFGVVFGLNEATSDRKISEPIGARTVSNIRADIRNAAGVNQDCGFTMMAFGDQ